MIYWIDLGEDFNNSNLYNLDFLKSLKSCMTININKYVNLEKVESSGKTSKFKIDEFKKLQLQNFVNIIKSDSLPIFLNCSNLSHEVSALTSAICFKQNGKHENKVILNLDNHKDADNADCSSWNTDKYLMFSTWGNCVRCEEYKKNINNECNYRYYVIGNDKKHSNNLLKAICEKIDQINAPFDLYLTIDTDVYKESFTFYGDGFLEYQCVYCSIQNFLYKYKSQINLCGVDITGFIDIDEGRFNKGLERKMLFSEKNELPDRAEQSHNKIKEILKLFPI